MSGSPSTVLSKNDSRRAGGSPGPKPDKGDPIDDPVEEPRGPASRRALLSVLGIGAGGLVSAACAPTPPKKVPVTPTTTPKPTTTLAAAQHLARRATFGATQADVQNIVAMGASAWIDRQLARTPLQSAEHLLGSCVTLKNTNEQNYELKKAGEDRIYDELDHATLLRAVYSKQQLYEVMCDFWTNHLNIWRRADWLIHLKTRENETVVRTHALGKFSDMLMASAKSPAMLVYLDNYQSRGEPGQQVNENYGRELLELHTLGIIDGNHVYSEADVVGVAKVLSGWGISWESGSLHDFQFNYWNHNREAVSILDGAWSRPARPKWGDYNVNGMADGESLIRFLARHPSTAKHLATKLVRRFVSDTPPPALVARLTSIYLANDTAIKPVLRALFLSTEFNQSVNQKVKRPLDWVVSALRATGAVIPTDPSTRALKDLRNALNAMGQPIFERVSPDGWPESSKYWIGADGLLKRWEYSASLARSTAQDPTKIKVDLGALLPTKLPSTASALVTWLAKERFQIVISNTEMQAICTAMGVSPTASTAGLTGSSSQLQECVGLLLAHPAFHRR